MSNGSKDAFTSLPTPFLALDPLLDDIRNAVSADEAYKTLTETFITRSVAKVKRLPASHPAALYKAYWDELSLHTDGKLLLYPTE